jgi:hypothetical protein
MSCTFVLATRTLMAVSVPRFRPYRPFLCAAVLVACGGTARADPADPGAAENLVKLRYGWHAQQARLEAAEEETKALAPPRLGASVGNFQDPSAVLNELRPVLADDYPALRNAAVTLADTARTRREEVQKEWEEVYRQRIAFRQYADRQQAVYGFDFDAGTQVAFKPTAFDAALLVWAALAFVAAVRLNRQVRRVAIRRLGRAAAAVAVVALGGVSGCADGSAPDARPWTVREEARLTADAKDAAEHAGAAVAEADRKWGETLGGWVELVTARAGSPQPVATILRDGETEVHNQLRDAAQNARLGARLAAEAEAERGLLAADTTKLAELTTGSKWRAIAFAAFRCGCAAVLFGLATGPYWRARRSEAAVIRADARKCPRCFGEKLVVEKTGVPPGTDGGAAPAPRYRAAKKKPAPAAAAADGPAETGYVECKACSFRFLRSYQRVRRLCFPVVGVRASGKTHMLATGYDRVRKRTAPTVAVVQPAPSLGDARFEQYIDMILNLKRDAGGTVHAMPDPVMLHVRDADPAGPSTALVNLFDYSGELVDSSVDVDRLKKQAVKMDGFMLFLDPTQLYGDGTNLTLDRQLAKLNEFMADMREARNVPVGEIIPVPVAVCIPKFDLLLTENPIQGQAVPFIRRMLSELNPPPKQTTLDTVRGRSDLVEQMLELMFRGVDVRGLVESYFGTRVMFFPVSSVSLFENELGIKDLSKRTVAPFGVAEPFLWLLHMHGYEVFA